jgi:flagellar basal body P-ring formation protein FlgA
MEAMARMVGWAAALNLLMAASLLADPQPGLVSPVVVSLREHVEVGCRTVTIGDVADVRSDNAALCKAVSLLDLGDPPGSQGTIQVTRRQVGFRVELAGLANGIYRVEGADVTTVTTAHYQPPESDIVAVAVRAVRERLSASDPEDFQIRLAQPLAIQPLVAGRKEDVTLRAQLHGATMPTAGRVQVDVSVLAGTDVRLSFSVYLEIRAYPKVAVVSRPIDKGETLSGAGIVFERRSVEGLKGYILSADDLVAKRARRALSPGQVVLVSDTDLLDDSANRLLIKQHDSVKLLVRLGAVNILATGEAQENGRLGQLIKVMNLESKKIVLGRVTERSIVEIDP